MEMKLTTNATPKSNCPYCGHTMNRATGRADGPRPGDHSICYECLNLLAFEADLSLRKLTVEEFAEINGDREVWDQIQKARAALRILKSNSKYTKSNPTSDS